MTSVIRKMKHNVAGIILVALMAVSCTGNEVFFQYQPIDPKGWSKDSLYSFDIPVTDSLASYNVYVNVRNTGAYPYQNLWLFLERMAPDSTMVRDSIELYLADQRGKWLGSGIGSIHEMPVLYQQNMRFNNKGTYQYRIYQGMRDELLQGIHDIGMKVEKVD